MNAYFLEYVIGRTFKGNLEKKRFSKFIFCRPNGDKTNANQFIPRPNIRHLAQITVNNTTDDKYKLYTRAHTEKYAVFKKSNYGLVFAGRFLENYSRINSRN